MRRTASSRDFRLFIVILGLMLMLVLKISAASQMQLEQNLLRNLDGHAESEQPMVIEQPAVSINRTLSHAAATVDSLLEAEASDS